MACKTNHYFSHRFVRLANVNSNYTVLRVIFKGENFCEFHESKTIRENFTLEMLTFNRYSLQSVTIRENFPLEKLRIAQFVKIFPLENNPLYGRFPIACGQCK